MKAQELKAKTPEQLREQLVALKKEAFNLRFQKASGELTNLSRFRAARREIARLLSTGQTRAALAALASIESSTPGNAMLARQVAEISLSRQKAEHVDVIGFRAVPLDNLFWRKPGSSCDFAEIGCKACVITDRQPPEPAWRAGAMSVRKHPLDRL